jgi:predicted RNA binding protein YcfA (HicA-like mRNA interferase family)
VSKNKKLLHRFLLRKNITVDDCDKLLIIYGYSCHKKSGSHLTYHKKGDTPINVVIPKNTKYVKPGYVDKIIKKLNLEAPNDD